MTTPRDTALAAAQTRRAEQDLPYYGAVLPREAQALLDAYPNAKLIDVRTRAESGSGESSMSDASIPFQPAIDEPSKAWPLSNLS